MSRPANVFSENYSIDFKLQQVWSIPHALEFFLLGVGAGQYILSTWFWPLPWAQLISLLPVIGAGLSLLADLGRPERLWRALANLRQSWISRGALSVFFFLAFAFLALFSRWTSSQSQLPLALESAATLFALIAMLYPGLVLSSYASIPSWNSPMVPLLFFLSSWITGLAAEWLVLLALGAARELAPAMALGLVLFPITLLCLLIHLSSMARGGAALREGYRLLVRGLLSGWFVGGAVGMGLLLPLVLVAVALINPEWLEFSALLSSLFVLAGGFLLRYSILKAGVYPPLF